MAKLERGAAFCSQIEDLDKMREGGDYMADETTPMSSTPSPNGKNGLGKWIGLIVIIVIVLIVIVMIRGGKKEGAAPKGTEGAKTPAATEGATPTQGEEGTETAKGAPVPKPGPIVTYQNSKFTPDSVEIKVGEFVTFVNGSDDELWVASNPHPVHTDLAGFDALKSSKKGESYSFTFTKEGTFGFHNHKNPGSTGQIVVKP